MNRMEVEARSEKSIQVEDDLTVLLNNSTSLGELCSTSFCGCIQRSYP
jgi:hypothetical protein